MDDSESMKDSNMDRLPSEVLEKILQAAIIGELRDARWAKASWEKRSTEVIDRLKTVCRKWNSVLSTKGFQITLQVELQTHDVKPFSLCQVGKKKLSTDTVSAVAHCKPNVYVVTYHLGSLRFESQTTSSSHFNLHVFEYKTTVCDMEFKKVSRLNDVESVSHIVALPTHLFLASDCLWKIPAKTLKPQMAMEFEWFTRVLSMAEGPNGRLLILTSSFMLRTCQLLNCCSEDPRKDTVRIMLPSDLENPFCMSPMPSGNLIVYHGPPENLIISELNVTDREWIKSKEVEEKDRGIYPIDSGFDRYGRILTRKFENNECLIFDADFNRYCSFSIPISSANSIPISSDSASETDFWERLFFGFYDSKNNNVVLLNKTTLYVFTVVE